MKIVYKFLASVAVLASVSACNLDYNPTNAQIYTNYDELFYEFEDASMYASLVDSYFRATQQGAFWQASDLQCDMFNSAINSGGQYGSLHTMSDSFSTTDEYANAVWSGYMGAVIQADYFIVNIKNVNLENLTPAELKKFNAYCGRAYLLRAFALYQSSLYFAPAYTKCDPTTALAVPVMLEPDVIARPKRQTLQTVFDQVEEDIKTAKKLLSEDVPAMSGSYYASYDAACALEAKFYLSKGEYTKAAAAADYLINCGTYELANTFAEITDEFITQNKCIESIFVCFASMAEGAPSNDIYYGQHTPNGSDFAYNPYFLPTKTLVNMYTATDIRKGVYLQEIGYSGANPIVTTMLFGKYRGNPSLSNNSFNECKTMPRVFAIPEQYLIAAEAMSMLGQEETAAEYLNVLQKARGAAQTSGSMENIKKEWARETVGEGMRLQCLKRWGDGFSGREPYAPSLVSPGVYYDELTVAGDYYKLTWPVPNAEIQSNQNLVQNPGWTTK